VSTQQIPRLLIVNGLPASGKTTLSRAVAPALGLPLISKDELKESLFDQLGWSDRERSKAIGGAAWELLWLLADRMLIGGGSLAIESAFQADRAAERIVAWRLVRPIRVVELHCVADRSVLAERFRARALGTERHPGHDEANLDILENEFLPRLLTGEDPLIPGTDASLTVDSTIPESIDIPTITRQLHQMLWPE
jgi:predicted kinase